MLIECQEIKYGGSVTKIYNIIAINNFINPVVLFSFFMESACL